MYPAQVLLPHLQWGMESVDACTHRCALLEGLPQHLQYTSGMMGPQVRRISAQMRLEGPVSH